MIKRNLSLKNKNYPFLLKPAGKDYIWGGNRLNEDFKKNIDMDPLAETWECSTHPDGQSYVASGEYTGKKLGDVLKKHPEFLGTHPKSNGDLPILVKFIDAKKDLSVQVHPDDEYAFKYENGQLGKTEMWYVLDATKDAALVYGFKYNMNKSDIKKSIKDGTIEKYLNKVSVKKGDLFYITPGTVHAIGAGALIAEIQENSNLTYRLYDYNRVDKNGKLRQLHIDKALDILNVNAAKELKQTGRIFIHKNGLSSEFLFRCKYFEVYKENVNTQNIRQLYKFKTSFNSFHTLLCVDGCGIIMYDKESIPFFKGDCIFVPANSVEIRIHGIASFLNISC